MSNKPNTHKIDATSAVNKQGADTMNSFAALASETPDPTRERAEGRIYEVEDEENLPTDAKSRNRAVLSDGDENEVSLSIWVAESDEERHIGLSNKRQLQEGHGMLFDWGDYGVNSLVMRDMDFALDMVFLDDSGYVRNTYTNVQPSDDKDKTGVCRYALELPAGTVDKHGIDDSWRAYMEQESEMSKNGVEVINVGKDRVYVNDAEDAPEDANVQEGDNGGTYYETNESEVEVDEDEFDDEQAVELVETLISNYGEKTTRNIVGQIFDVAPQIGDALISVMGNLSLSEDSETLHRQEQVPPEAIPYTDPDEVPEGARTIEGPREGNYYIPVDDTEGDGDEGIDLSERDAEIGDDSVHPAKWRRPEEGELDTYIEEIQETEFWSGGHETFKKAFHGDENTENEYTDEEGNWDEDRLEQHQEWGEDLVNEDAAADENEQPVGMIVLGPPGAGKGWWQEQVAEGEYGDDLGGRNFTQISSDRTKEPIPEYDGGNAAEVHDEASKVAKENLAPEAFENEHNVIVDKVAGDPESTLKMVEKMQEKGYDIRASFVDVPSEKSVHNAVGRYEEEGRFTPLEYTAGARDDSKDSFDTIVEEADIPEEKVGRFDNDVEWGQAPDAEQLGEDLLKFLKLLHDEHDFNRYIKQYRVSSYGNGKARPGRDSQRNSKVDERELRRGANGGSGRGSSRRGNNERPQIIDLRKSRTYINDPSEAPEDVSVQEGEQGGYYYETSDRDSPDNIEDYDGVVNLSGMDDQQKEEVNELVESAVEKDWMSNVDGVTTEPSSEVKDKAVAAYNPANGELFINPESFNDDTLRKGEETGWLTSGTKEGMFAHEVGHARHREEARDQLFSIDGGTVIDIDEDKEAMLEEHVSKTAAESLSEAIAEIHAGLAVGQEFPDEVMELYNQFDGPEVNDE